MGNKGKRATYRCSPPLPFQGNKSIGRLRFLELLKNIKDGNNKLFVDLFGGSFYLSYLIHQVFPNAKVICNDFDNYLQRLKNIQSTKDLLTKIKAVVTEARYKKIVESKEKVNQIIREHEGFIDLITLSSNLLYSSFTLTDIDKFLNHEFYNLLVKTDYDPAIDDYIDGIEFRSCHWNELFNEFKDTPNCVFIADPPYLYTDKSGYMPPVKEGQMWRWTVEDSLKVLDVMKTDEFVYYCADKPGTYDFIKYLKNQANLLKDFKVVVYRRHPVNKHATENKEILLYRLDLENEVAEDLPVKQKKTKETSKKKNDKKSKVKFIEPPKTLTRSPHLHEEEDDNEPFFTEEEDSDTLFNEEENDDDLCYDEQLEE